MKRCISALASNILILLLSAGCSTYVSPPLDEILRQHGITSDAEFRRLPVCRQVELLIEIAPELPNEVPFASETAVPGMILDTLSHEGEEAAICAIANANRLSPIYHGNTAESKIAYKGLSAMNSVLDYMQRASVVTRGGQGANLVFPEAQAYLHNQVCEQKYPDILATRAYYMSKFQITFDSAFNPASEAFTSTGTSKMRDSVCK